MSANVESMFYVRTAPWHGLGVEVKEALSSKDALKVAGLDWRVLQEDVYTDGHGGIYTDIIVPEGHIFAMGDNRTKSQDCRQFGCIPLEKIEGKVTIRFWPLNRWGTIKKAE